MSHIFYYLPEPCIEVSQFENGLVNIYCDFFKKSLNLWQKNSKFFQQWKFSPRKKKDGMSYLKEILSGKLNYALKDIHLVNYCPLYPCSNKTYFFTYGVPRWNLLSTQFRDHPLSMNHLQNEDGTQKTSKPVINGNNIFPHTIPTTHNWQFWSEYLNISMKETHFHYLSNKYTRHKGK